MKRKIKRLPNNAKYDHRDIFGYEIYHTDRRIYTVKCIRRFGKLVTNIYSYSEQEYYNK